MTYGFRGEALSSISSISEVTLLTLTRARNWGPGFTTGKVSGVLGICRSAGTTVIVENLFFNVPARKKFLKSPRPR
jgi:DNA mismatch repair protein MutL